VLGKFFNDLYAEAAELNRRNLISLVRDAGATGGVLMDLGCDDGEWTLQLARSIDASEVHGVEIVPEQADKAEQKGVRVARLNLNAPMHEVPSEHFDVVHSNQVIEHVASVDSFVSEVYRLLKPGGVAVISTENASSWHNVFAAAMGWQIFSLTNVSEKMSGLGNPCALHRGKPPFMGTWTHKTIFSYRGLIEMFQAHGFRDVVMKGAGYFPLPARLGTLDVRHSAFITVRARK
jgi:ubiquinone/menaquinone biosynthesis C-methylase UbiE